MNWDELRATLVCQHQFSLSYDSYDRVMTYDCAMCPLVYDSTIGRDWHRLVAAWEKCLIDRWLRSGLEN